MPSDPVVLTGLAIVVSTGVVAGVFVTFSDFIMRSLERATPQAGIEAMQMINRQVYASLFLPLFLGLGAISMAIAGYAAWIVPEPAAAWLIMGAVVYVTGVIAVTMLCNVPMNRRLDALVPDSAAARAYWTVYRARWTRWNHVRSIASLAAAGCYAVALVRIVSAL